MFSDSNPPFSSLSDSGEVIGLIPELTREIFNQLKSYTFDYGAYPWNRAQYLVETSQKEIFCTYPSSSRQEYALFTVNPVLYLDYDYLIFNRNNERVGNLLEVDEIEDLKEFVLVSHSATAWEDDNIPRDVERLYVNKHEQLFHMVFGRETGDFFIMNLEEAIYHATRLGYSEKLIYKKVGFIPESSIPFHLGIRKTYESGAGFIDEVDKILESDSYILRSKAIFRKYN